MFATMLVTPLTEALGIRVCVGSTSFWKAMATKILSGRSYKVACSGACSPGIRELRYDCLHAGL